MCCLLKNRNETDLGQRQDVRQREHSDEGQAGFNCADGDGPDGHIEANAYSVDQKGEHVIFDGNVRGRFVTQKEEGQ